LPLLEQRAVVAAQTFRWATYFLVRQKAPVRQSPSKPQWEYKVVNLKVDKKIEAQLNEFGAQGWELVSYNGFIASGTGVDAGTFFFKRPK
jgi:hypothetical protein